MTNSTHYAFAKEFRELRLRLNISPGMQSTEFFVFDAMVKTYAAVEIRYSPNFDLHEFLHIIYDDVVDITLARVCILSPN